MNTARAHQVLTDISNSVAVIESECERLCILINECRQGEYWRVLYKSEKDWGLAVFGSTSAFRHLAAMASAYKDEPALIGEIGRRKAELLIPVMRKEGTLSRDWRYVAKKVSGDRLANLVREQYPSRREPKQEMGILRHEIEGLENRIANYQRAIERLTEKLESKRKRLQMYIEGAA